MESKQADSGAWPVSRFDTMGAVQKAPQGTGCLASQGPYHLVPGAQPRSGRADLGVLEVYRAPSYLDTRVLSFRLCLSWVRPHSVGSSASANAF